MNKILGIVLIVISASSFGAMAILASFVYQSGVDPITALWLRFTIAAITLLLVSSISDISLPSGRNLFGLMLIGSVGFVMQSFCFFTALKFISASLVTTLLYLYPVIVTVITTFLYKEKLDRIKLLALVCAVIGVFLATEDIFDLQSVSFIGVLFALASAVVYAAYVVIGGKIMRHENEIGSVTVILGSAATVFTLITLGQGAKFPATSIGWLGIIGIALISTVVAVLALFAGIKRIGATQASVLSTLEPVVTSILAVPVLHQNPTPVEALGIVLILVSALIACSFSAGEVSESVQG